MSEQEKVSNMEQRLNDYGERVATLEATLKSIPEITANKVMEKMEEKYVSKEYAKNLIAVEREKSDNRYVFDNNLKTRCNEYHEEYESKKIDVFSKKVKMWTLIQALITGSIGFIIGIITKYSSLVGSMFF